MFTEEAAMSDLIREGLMALWSSQSEGKFVANELESRSKKSKSGRETRNDNEMQVMDLHDELCETKSSLKGWIHRQPLQRRFPSHVNHWTV